MVAKIRVKRRKGKSLLGNTDGPQSVKAGFPMGQVNNDILSRAVWTHYGTQGGGWGGPIPARPFITNTVRNNQRKYLRILRESAAMIVSGDESLNSFMTKLGIVVQGDIQSEITDLRDPPNSPVTIALKGSSNPLIDTGQMRQSVTYAVSS